MDKLRSMLGRTYEQQEDDPDANGTSGSAAGTPADTERGFLAEALDASTLSWSTRVQGFAACFILGVAISVLATVMFALSFSLSAFGILYTLGNIVALCSTFFLMGPVNQLKRMFHSTRWIASTVMLVCLFFTLFSAFYLQKKGLTILFCIFQFCAMTWYSLSYIPYARDLVKKTFNSLIS